MATDKRLESLVSEIKLTRADAEIDLEQVPYKVRPGFGIRKDDAMSKLTHLVSEYNQLAATKVATIIVSGPEHLQQKFVKLAEEEGGTITVDAQDAYVDMSKSIEPSLGDRKTFSTTQMSHLIYALEAVGKKLGLSMLRVPDLRDGITVDSTKDLVSVVKDIIEVQTDSSIGRRYNESAVLEKALKTECAERVIPVVVSDVLNLGHSNQKLFNTTLYIEVAVKEEPTKEFVLGVFKGLQNQIKSRK